MLSSYPFIAFFLAKLGTELVLIKVCLIMHCRPQAGVCLWKCHMSSHCLRPFRQQRKWLTALVICTRLLREPWAQAAERPLWCSGRCAHPRLAFAPRQNWGPGRVWSEPWKTSSLGSKTDRYTLQYLQQFVCCWHHHHNCSINLSK